MKYRCSEILSVKNISPLLSKCLFVCYISERFLQIALANLAIRKVDCCVMVVHLKGSVENVECGVRSVENTECGK